MAERGPDGAALRAGAPPARTAPASTDRSAAVVAGAGEGAKALLSSLATVAQEPGPGPDPMVSVAFTLGWQMAELYRPAAWPSSAPKPGPHLPGMSELSGAQHALVGLDHVDVALDRLYATITEHGLTAPTTDDARNALTGATPTTDRFRAAIFELHVSLLSTLTAAGFNVGTAYGLGRALADTTREPQDLDGLHKQLGRDRVANIQAWLADLTSALPAHSATPVKASLERWRDWAAETTSAGGDEVKKSVRLLRRQGQRWRALLSGEKQATDLLELQDYALAGSNMLKQLGSLTWRFLGRFAVLLVPAAALFAGGVVLILADSNSAQVVAGIGGVLASFGLTWKGAGNSLGKAAGHLERPLWEASVDRQIATALTLLPGSRRFKHYTPPEYR
jgi:hypothetical protein